MGGSIKLLTVRGIDIRVHVTFPLILVWAVIQFGLLTGQGVNGAIFGIIVTLLLFAIVVLHELGHSLAAQYYGVPVRQIVLLPLGGVAQLERIPENPGQELVIAIAGPLVNGVIALLMVAANQLFQLSSGYENLSRMMNGLAAGSLAAIFGYVFFANLYIALFNLVPAFPLDGGRILRALLASRLEYRRATAIAVTIGQTLAWLIGLWGFLSGEFFLVLIAIFIYVGAGQEGQQVQLRRALGDVTVDQAYSRQVQTLSPQSLLHDAVELTLTSFQADFPVCEGGRLVGLLPYSRLIEALDRGGPDTLVQAVMLTDIRPVSPREKMFDVQQRMAQEKLDALPVIEDGHFLGLITGRDIGEIYRLVTLNPELIPRTRPRA